MLIKKLPKEHKQYLVNRLQDYFYEERSEEISELAAGLLLDFVLKEIGPVIYNQAIDDTIQTTHATMASMEENLYAMKKIIKDID